MPAYELLHRCAVAFLLLAGVLTAVMPADWLAAGTLPAGLAVHRQLLAGLTAVGLIVAVAVPSWRMPAAAAAIVSRTAFLIIDAALPGTAPALAGPVALEAVLLVLLLAAAAVFAREAWQEARWNGVLPLPLEMRCPRRFHARSAG